MCQLIKKFLAFNIFCKNILKNSKKIKNIQTFIKKYLIICKKNYII